MQKTKRILGSLLILMFSVFIVSCGKAQQISNENNASAKTEKTATTKTTKVAGELKVHYIDVGQGDSELIQVDGKNILIDAGTSDKKALDYLKSIGITTIDYAIATHPHEDHIGSMDDVINNLKVGTFYAPKATTTTKTFENMVDALK
ncbi:MBL fold metallo-hydrolase, partial [Clostridium beijerinckii]